MTNSVGAPHGAKDARQEGVVAGSVVHESDGVGRVFIQGMCRNDQHKIRSHLYEVVYEPDYTLIPMCGYAWNRSSGHGFSIFRGHQSQRGTCKLCEANVAADKPAVRDGWEHKTKWL